MTQQPLFESLVPEPDAFEASILAGGLPFICEAEGLVCEPYLDSVGVATIGYGTTFYPDGSPVTMQDTPITKEVAMKLLEDHVRKDLLPSVRNLCPGLNANQYAALVSFAYNLGLGALTGSTLRKKVLAGDIQGAADQFLRWNMAGGKVLNGLTKRRERERTLFLS